MKATILITFLILRLHLSASMRYSTEEAARIFMENLNREQAEKNYELTFAKWAYATNITQENLERTIQASIANAKWQKEKWHAINAFPWKNIKDEKLKRQFKKYSSLGRASLPDDKYEKLTEIMTQMKDIHSTAKICSYSDPNKCDLAMEPDIVDILQDSEDPEELKHTWVKWHDATGRKMRPIYKDYIDLSNEAVQLKNVSDVSVSWKKSYADPNFTDDIKEIWEKIRPLYLELHAYVRSKLRQKYGDNIISRDGCIPAHLLGNMFAQSWVNVYKFMIPYPEVKTTDVKSEMIAQGYTPLKIFQMAEEFFISINMSAMTQEFWENSVFEKPTDREIICHASAWDFYNARDFRIKMCTEIQQRSFHVIHHEMGHVEYYLSYKDQPTIFRRGANPGFHEAIGDVIALSVSSDRHLQKVGLLKDYVDNEKSNINKLFETALKKIVFLPFAYITDLWRWGVFSGKIPYENSNAAWWKLKNDYQGVQAPVPRTEEDLDPGAKFHVATGTPFIKYYVSYIIQFQFHKALCEKAGQYEPNNPEKALFKCDIYQNTDAGNALKKMLQLGSSEHWKDAMESLTGGRNMDAGPILEYFAPLHEWLVKENEKNGEFIGWR